MLHANAEAKAKAKANAKANAKAKAHANANAQQGLPGKTNNAQSNRGCLISGQVPGANYCSQSK